MIFKRDKSFLSDPKVFRSNALTKSLGIKKAFTSKEALASIRDSVVSKKTKETAKRAMAEMGLN